MKSDLDKIPADIAQLSISTREIVLPLESALQAVDHLLQSHTKVLGWEAWVRKQDGKIGHPSTICGTDDLSSMTLQQAATHIKDTMATEHQRWINDSNNAGEIFFCLSIET